MKVIFVIIFYFFSFCVSAQNKDRSYLIQKKYQEILPVTFSNFIVLSNIKINNSSDSYNFILDTGSAYTVLSKQIADELNIISRGSIQVGDGITTEKLNTGVVDIHLNELTFKNVNVAVADLDFIKEYTCHIDGILGINVMRHSVWNIKKDTVIVSNELKNFNLSGYGKEKMKMEPCPSIKIELKNNLLSDMLLDLGDNTLIAYSSDAVPYIRKEKILKGWGKYCERLFTEHIDSVEIFIPKASLTILGETPFFGVVGEVNYDSAAPQSSIGLQLLDYYNLILDFPHKKIYYQQLKDQYDVDTWKNFGFKYRINEDGIFVSFLWENSDAQEKGIKIDDKIVSISSVNYEDIKGTPFCEIRALVDRELNKEQVGVKIESEDGVTRDFILQKKNLFRE